MSCAILLVGTVAGELTEFDGQFVKAYDPSYVHPDGYDGGLLETTSDLSEAMRFPDVQAALEKWRQPFGMRWDGEPERPLTAWSVEFQNIPDENVGKE
jgi:hypothetical protein